MKSAAFMYRYQRSHQRPFHEPFAPLIGPTALHVREITEVRGKRGGCLGSGTFLYEKYLFIEL